MQVSSFADLQNPWQHEEVITDAERYFDGMLDAIRQARARVDLDFYMMELDSIGERFIEALSAAVTRGVRVRMVIDGVGSYEGAAEIAQRLSTAGVDIRVYHPLPFTWKAFRWSFAQGNFLQKLVYFSLQVNKRNHHKLCVVDGRHLWTGSINLSASHLPKDKGGEGWRDCAVHIQDAAASETAQRMYQHWFKADQNKTRLGVRRLWTDFTQQQRVFKRRYIIRCLRHAKQRIWITSAYFAPPQSIVRALLYAASQGVDVRVILPARSDVPVFPLLSRSYYKQLVDGGVKVYEYQASILHAKLVMIDDACLIGSTNLNHRSWFHDLEVDTLLTQKKSIEALELMMKEDREASVEILSRVNFPWYQRWAMRCVKQFRYWF